MVFLEEKGRSIEAVLEEAGFLVSHQCCSRPSCFDFAARKGKFLILIKKQHDIGKVSRRDAWELRAVSHFLGGNSVYVSETARGRSLEDDTVYSRYTISAMTKATFDDTILRGIQPLVQAGPGGYYVKIDGARMRTRRQEMGLSIGELAALTGISRRTLYGYERNLGKASVSAAYNLVCILKAPVARPIDALTISRIASRFFLRTARRTMAQNRLLRTILSRLAVCKIVSFRKAPFDFLVSPKEGKTAIIGGIADKKERGLAKRLDEILSICKVIDAHAVLISEGRQSVKSNDVNFHCINTEDLLHSRDPRELIENLK